MITIEFFQKGIAVHGLKRLILEYMTDYIYVPYYQYRVFRFATVDYHLGDHITRITELQTTILGAHLLFK